MQNALEALPLAGDSAVTAPSEEQTRRALAPTSAFSDGAPTAETPATLGAPPVHPTCLARPEYAIVRTLVAATLHTDDDASSRSPTAQYLQELYSDSIFNTISLSLRQCTDYAEESYIGKISVPARVVTLNKYEACGSGPEGAISTPAAQRASADPRKVSFAELFTPVSLRGKEPVRFIEKVEEFDPFYVGPTTLGGRHYSVNTNNFRPCPSGSRRRKQIRAVVVKGLFHTPSSQSPAGYRRDYAMARGVQSGLSLRVYLDELKTGKDYKELASKPQCWNYQKVFDDMQAAKLRQYQKDRPANSVLKAETIRDEAPIQWPTVTFGSTTEVFGPSPVCTDAQSLNCSVYEDPLVRNKAPHTTRSKNAAQQVFGADTSLFGDILPAVAATSYDAGTTAIIKAYEVGIKKWIADTGSGLHLIPRSAVRKSNNMQNTRKVQDPFCLQTAGGLTHCDTVLEAKLDMLDEKYIVGHVLDSTPPVVSVGRLVQDHGYNFIWLHAERESPRFETPTGQIIKLAVEDYIPYFITTEDTSKSECRRIPRSALQCSSPAPPSSETKEPHPDASTGETTEPQPSFADGVPEENLRAQPSTPRRIPSFQAMRLLLGDSPPPAAGDTDVEPSENSANPGPQEPHLIKTLHPCQVIRCSTDMHVYV